MNLLTYPQRLFGEFQLEEEKKGGRGRVNIRRNVL